MESEECDGVKQRERDGVRKRVREGGGEEGWAPDGEAQGNTSFS